MQVSPSKHRVGSGEVVLKILRGRVCNFFLSGCSSEKVRSSGVREALFVSPIPHRFDTSQKPCFKFSFPGSVLFFLFMFVLPFSTNLAVPQS